MSGAVAWTHQIVEGSEDPLTIPQRPMRIPGAGSLGVEFREMRDRLLTYEVWHETDGLVGYLRWADDGSWRARTLGSADESADVKSHPSREAAVAWLQQRLIGGGSKAARTARGRSHSIIVGPRLPAKPRF
jgi:hypothetical protein